MKLNRTIAPWADWLAVVATLALLLLAVLGVEGLADTHSAPPPMTVAPPAWMENVTSACAPVGHYRVWAYQGTPFTVTSDGTC